MQRRGQILVRIGVAERLAIGVRERELSKTCTRVKGGPSWEAWMWRAGWNELRCIGNVACERRGTACIEAAGKLVARRRTRVT